MKTIRTYFYRTSIITFLFALSLNGFGQSKKIEKTYRWKQDVNKHVNFVFQNYDCNITIHTWDKAEIEYLMTVDATLKSVEDAKKLDEHIEKQEFSHSEGGIEFDNRFWTGKKVIMGRKIMTLKGARTIRFTEFKMKGEMWIPENCNLLLQSKYSEIKVADLNGRTTLKLYNDKLFGGQVNGSMEITAKYSTLEFKDMKDVKADLYNTDIEAGKIGNLQAESKYSNFNAGDAEKVDLDSYNDKYSFENTGDIRFINKYSDLKALNAEYIELDCYNSTISLKTVQDIDLKSKYSKYKVEVVRNLNITSAYSDNCKIGKLDALNITESKYSVYRIDHLESSLILKEGYSDKFFITDTGAFQGMKLNGKYIVTEMALDKNLSYSFKADVKYPKFDINEEAMNVRIKIKEGSDLKMEAVKGIESEGMPAFFVNGYEMAVTLTEN